MAHFAEIDPTGIVLRVLVLADELTQDEKGDEAEAIGAALLAKCYGGRWVQTSYNHRVRGNFAGPGWSYDSTADVFVPPPAPPEDPALDAL